MHVWICVDSSTYTMHMREYMEAESCQGISLIILHSLFVKGLSRMDSQPAYKVRLVSQPAMGMLCLYLMTYEITYGPVH